MESTLKKECICKKMLTMKGIKRQKPSGVLNPAFDDFDISEVYFADSSETSYWKVDAVSDAGLPHIENNGSIDSICPDSPVESSIQMNDSSSSYNSTRAITPINRNKKYDNNNCCKYSLYLLIWCVITVSFAGIFASVASIIWLETYKVKSDSIQLVSEVHDPNISLIESLTQSSLITDNSIFHISSNQSSVTKDLLIGSSKMTIT